MIKDYNGTSDYMGANVDNETTQDGKELDDWKSERIAKYAHLESLKQQVLNDFAEDKELAKLNKGLDKVEELIGVRTKPYHDKITECEQQQAGIKLELAEKWDTSFKEYACDAGTATLRTTRSLHIRSKEKLVAFLELNKKLTEFIKNFEITKLRKIKDAGMLEDEIATWDEKKNVAIKIAEAEQ